MSATSLLAGHDHTASPKPAPGVSSRAADEQDRIRQAEILLGHEFARPELLREALTHRSFSQGRARKMGIASNERLEFIGDRVLGLVMAEWVAERFPDEQEGKLGPRLAHLVSRDAVAAVAGQAGLAKLLSLGVNEAQAGVGRQATVLADALEALLGALFLDTGLDPARVFIRRAWEGAMQAQILPPKDPKTALQEWLLARGETLPDYRVISAEGPSHAPRFVIAVSAHGMTGEGVAGSKRQAEREAAASLLARLA